ncbi:MAG: hypothetical protein HKN74_02975 [Acidimicrobiia bacterium]|nr:hypothetical protein [Acidimicrobiia bacterium]NNF09227.1 hypothetical protein [Acidimicrobiia bacterium]NNL71131.1 hypothetical protein [Acidimicrobiia bacterium]
MAVGRGGGLGVDVDADDGSGGVSGGECAVEPILGNGDQGIGAQLLAGDGWVGGEPVGAVVEGSGDDGPVVGGELGVQEADGLIEVGPGSDLPFRMGLLFVAAANPVVSARSL